MYFLSFSQINCIVEIIYTISYFTLYLAIYHKHCEKSLHTITFHYKLDIVILHNFALINRAIIKTVFHAFTYYFLSKDP